MENPIKMDELGVDTTILGNPHMEPENWWIVNVSPFFREVFSGSMLVFGGVVYLISCMLRRRCGNDVDVWSSL